MSREAAYAGMGTAGVALVIFVLWPFLDPASRVGLLVAAAIALPVQWILFAALMRFRGKPNGFLGVWVGGTAVRMMVIGVTAFVAVNWGVEGALALLFGLAGFLFGLLLLEPRYFKPVESETT
jgi:hypothetical protein